MADPKRRSKRQSGSSKRLKGFTLYLCNNIDYDACVAKLRHCGFRFKRHKDYFSGSTPDTTLLKKVGERRWILITADQKQRTREVERNLIKHYKIRQFVFTSGEVGDVGELLCKAKSQMRNLCAKNAGPFIASISRSGNVSLRSIPN